MELLPLATAAMLGNVDVSAQVVLSLAGNFERNVVQYECEGIEELLTVDYINAEPNFLAVVPLAGQKRVFVAVAAASGVRYVSGQFEWWTKGSETTLTDIMVDEGEALSCLEHSETP
jgi:membrane-bound inhibitor of C-type lysozyme